MEIPALAPVDGPPALFSVLISDEVSVLLDDSGSIDDGLEELVEVMIVRCDEVEVALVEVDLDVIDVIVADAGSVAVPVGSQYCSQTIQYLFSISITYFVSCRHWSGEQEWTYGTSHRRCTSRPAFAPCCPNTPTWYRQ